MTVTDTSTVPPRGDVALALLARLARAEGAAPLSAADTAAHLPWLARRQIDSLVEDNPFQPLYDRIWARQRVLLGDVLTTLDGAGIDVLTFKGAEYLQRLGGASAMNVLGDVDVLIRAAQREDARRALLATGLRHGFARRGGVDHLSPERVAEVERGHYELAPLVRVEKFPVTDAERALVAALPVPVAIWPDERGDLWIALSADVHDAPALDVDSSEFFARAVPRDAGAGMSAADLLWLTVSRYYIEVATDTKRSLRDFFYAITLLRGTEPVDWDVVAGAADRFTLGASLYYYLAFLRSAFGLPIPDEVIEAASPLRTARRRDWGWQLGVLFDFVEPFPFAVPAQLART